MFFFRVLGILFSGFSGFGVLGFWSFGFTVLGFGVSGFSGCRNEGLGLKISGLRRIEERAARLQLFF